MNMRFYDNIFACYFSLTNRFSKLTPKYGAFLMVSVSQFLLYVALYQFAHRFLGIFDNWTKEALKMLWFGGVVFIFVGFGVYFYRKGIMDAAISNFQKKSSRERTIWVIISIINYVGPICALPFLFPNR
jgi:hypothetical protein